MKYSLDEEYFFGSDDILDMLESDYYDNDELPDFVYYGEEILYTHKDFINLRYLTESMGDIAYENSEFSDGYLSDLTNKKAEELENIIIKWFNENVEQPQFYYIPKVNKMSTEEFLEKFKD